MIIFTPVGVIIGGVAAAMTPGLIEASHDKHSRHRDYGDAAERRAKKQAEMDSKQRQVERLENDVKNCFLEGFAGLRNIENTDSLPTFRNAQQRQEYFKEHIDEFKSGVMKDAEQKVEAALSADREELRRINAAIAAINDMQLNSKR